jgi:hypothetical protein
MNRLFLRTVLAVVTATGMALAAAGGGADPVIGLWQLDASQSTFTAGPALKSQTRTYTQSGPNISLVMASVGADGKEGTTKTTYQMDGKDYPVTGTGDYDSLMGKQVDSHSAEFTLKKGGKKIGTSTRSVSADGKTLTSKMSATSASGEKTEQTLVFHKK